MKYTVLGLFFVTMLMVGCGGNSDTDADDLPDPERSTTSGGSLPSGYSVVDVQGGGRITGKVMLEGDLPADLPTFDITANADICGGAAANNRLQAGPDGGVRYALVYLEGVTRGKAPPALSEAERTIDQQGCRYSPHLTAAPVGTVIRFRNSDPTAHNVRVQESEGGRILLNLAQPSQGRVDEFTLETPGLLAVGCDYHPWMNAYIYAMPHPYYAVTDANGAFAIEDVPEGSYIVKMWFNGVAFSERRDNNGRLIRYEFDEPFLLRDSVTVGAGENVEVSFRIDPGRK